MATCSVWVTESASYRLIKTRILPRSEILRVLRHLCVHSCHPFALSHHNPREHPFSPREDSWRDSPRSKASFYWSVTGYLWQGAELSSQVVSREPRPWLRGKDVAHPWRHARHHPELFADWGRWCKTELWVFKPGSVSGIPEHGLTHPTYILQWDQTNWPRWHSGLWFLVRKDLVRVKRKANGIQKTRFQLQCCA